MYFDVFPIKNGDIPASYVSLPEGKVYGNTEIPQNRGETFSLVFLL